MVYNFTTTTEIVVRKSLHGKKKPIPNKVVALPSNITTFPSSKTTIIPMKYVALLAWLEWNHSNEVTIIPPCSKITDRATTSKDLEYI